jgi:hypothetical protein
MRTWRCSNARRRASILAISRKPNLEGHAPSCPKLYAMRAQTRFTYRAVGSSEPEAEPPATPIRSGDWGQWPLPGGIRPGARPVVRCAKRSSPAGRRLQENRGRRPRLHQCKVIPLRIVSAVCIALGTPDTTAPSGASTIDTRAPLPSVS